MIPEQLDLFGKPPKPPKKILVDEEDIKIEHKVEEESERHPVAVDHAEHKNGDNVEANSSAAETDESDSKPEATVERSPVASEEFVAEEKEAFGELAENAEATPKEENTNESTDRFAPDVIEADVQNEKVESISAHVSVIAPAEEAVKTEESEEPGDEGLRQDSEGDDWADEKDRPNTSNNIPEDEEGGLEELESKPPLLESAPQEHNAETKHAGEDEPVKADRTPFKAEQGNVPADEILFRRQYYSMRETSTMLGITQSLLRFWENEFDILRPRKNRKGDRYFRPIDIKNLQLIIHLLKVRLFTLDGAREYLRTHNKALDNFEVIQKLEKLKGFLHELKAHL